MVQGLAFLSKKSWHTKNLANQEKVWMAEQQKAAEESKTKELAKQIQQEREEEELDKIAGRKNVRRDRGIDWMYQGGTGAAAKEEELRKNEEYLLGKEFQPGGETAGGDFANLETGGVNDVLTAAKKPAAAASEPEPAVAAAEEDVAAVASAPAEPSVADRNEAFRMRHEDPMFVVSQTRRDQQNQQDKKRALYERVVGPTEDKKPSAEDDSEARRRSKKERKRERKQRRREEKEARREDRHHRKRHRRARSRSRSPSRDHKRHYHHKRRHRSRSPSRDNERRRSSRSPSETRYYSDEDRRYDSRRRDRSRSRSYDREHRRRYRSRSPSPRDYRRRERSPRDEYGRRDEHYERQDYRNRKPSPPPRRYEEDHSREGQRPSRPEGFGLQGGKTSSPSSRHDDLGPNRQLLERKRQELESERRRIRETASTRRRMTPEERAAELRAMEQNASKRDEFLNRAVAAKSQGMDDDHAPSSGKASFLQDMAERTHGIRDGGSLAKRVAQNRHTNQKLSDGFL